MFIETLETACPDGFEWRLDILENDGHVPVASLNNGLLSLFPDFLITDALQDEGLEAVDRHYRNLTRRYGFRIETPEEVLFHMAYTLKSRKDYPGAVELFIALIGRYPKSYRAHHFLGETYEEAGDRESAVRCYRKTLELNPDFDRAKKKLENILKN